MAKEKKQLTIITGNCNSDITAIDALLSLGCAADAAQQVSFFKPDIIEEVMVTLTGAVTGAPALPPAAERVAALDPADHHLMLAKLLSPVPGDCHNVVGLFPFITVFYLPFWQKVAEVHGRELRLFYLNSEVERVVSVLSQELQGEQVLAELLFASSVLALAHSQLPSITVYNTLLRETELAVEMLGLIAGQLGCSSSFGQKRCRELMAQRNAYIAGDENVKLQCGMTEAIFKRVQGFDKREVVAGELEEKLKDITEIFQAFSAWAALGQRYYSLMPSAGHDEKRLRSMQAALTEASSLINRQQILLEEQQGKIDQLVIDNSVLLRQSRVFSPYSREGLKEMIYPFKSRLKKALRYVRRQVNRNNDAM